MNTLFSILTMGKQSLLTQQRAIDVTSHNIANVNTPGYSRQRAIMSENPPLSIMGFDNFDQSGQYGTGVEIDYVKRVRDMFLDLGMQDTIGDLAAWQEKYSGLQQVENIFMELAEGALNSDLDAFWNAWHLVAQDPTSETYRMDLLRKAQNVTGTLNRIYDELYQLRREIDNKISFDVNRINTLSQKIAQYNLEIMKVEGGGQNANDLRDERWVLVEELSEIIDIEVSENPKGGLVISLNEVNLVQDGSTNRMGMYGRADGFTGLRWEHSGIGVIVDSGRLGGILEVRDVLLPDYLNQVQTFKQNLATTVNAQHQLGDDFYGNPGVAFFDFNPALSPDISVSINYNELYLIAAAGRDQGRGDNKNAVALAGLRDAIQTGYLQLVSQYGEETENAGMMVNLKSSAKAQLEEQRQSISGVSLDEEMANMIKFQYAYQAAARMITTVDEMLDTVINRMGLVGR